MKTIELLRKMVISASFVAVGMLLTACPSGAPDADVGGAIEDSQQVADPSLTEEKIKEMEAEANAEVKKNNEIRKEIFGLDPNSDALKGEAAQ
jgi:Ser-tRNA(Ala) deacylase AlaX